MRRVLPFLAVAFLSLVPAAGGAVTGPQRVLVILATWGPQPFSQQEAQRRAIEGASTFVQNSSYGTASIVGTVTPWLRAFPEAPASCEPRAAIADAARAAAIRAGQTLDGFDRFVYVIPRVPCTWGGYGSGDEVWLDGSLSPGLVAHELGHTWGLAHANRWDCSGGSCRPVEYGDRYSVMGSRADGQFDAYEKAELGWLVDADLARAERNGTYTVDQLEQPSALPQALVVTTARNEYWIDHREAVLEDAWLAGNPVVEGVFVHAGPNLTGAEGPAASPFGAADYLLENPARPAVDAFLPGDAFEEPGAFRLTVLRHGGTRVDVDFRWTDTTRPRPPRITTPRRVVRSRSRMLYIDWDAASDAGSGVSRYEVWVDGGRRSVVQNSFLIGNRLELPRPRPGRHGVRVVAIDRAGNRSAIALARFTIPRTT